MRFEELDLNESLLAGIKDARFETCMPVQERTFAETLEKRDVYVQSQTGSGKTAAFLITILEHFERGTFDRKRAVIIVPTRELAVQIEEEAKLLGSHLPYRIVSIYGGVGYDQQLRMLEQDVEIIVGTPGRLIDLNERRKLDFRDTSVLVIDEADRLFDMGFIPDLRRMLSRMPDRKDRLTMLFSATLNSRVWHLAWEHMNDPVQIILNPENLTVDEVNQELYHVSRSEKMRLLLGILKREQPENALIFTNTKSGAVEVSRRLNHNGYESQYIIGDLPQKKRLKLIERMKAGQLQILVATDVAARGLHIDDLPLVVNYDIPEDPEGYVHRIGRTARAGSTGKAISLACERFVYGLEAIEELIDRKIPVEWHDESLLAEDQSAGMRMHDDDQPRSGGRSRSGSSRSNRGGRSRSGDRSSSRSGGGRPTGQSEQRTDHARAGGSDRKRDEPSRSGGSSRNPEPKPASARAKPAEQKPHQETSGERRPGRPPASSRPASTSTGKPSRNRKSDPKKSLSAQDSMEERLAYYREKYGEDFQLVESTSTTDEGHDGQSESDRKPLLKRLFGKKGKS